MKAVLISINPKYCELIANGKKTVEVRKSKPKLETPFKVYIYCTNNGGSLHKGYGGLYYHKSNVGKNDSSCINGKVIGEFVCSNIAKGNSQLGSCISMQEISEYANGKEVYGWCISDLVIYEKPKELSEFRSYNLSVYVDDNGYPMPTHEIKRPPRSWCYVESEG